ncbi:MAG: hypothetical protein GY715_12765 [Planctomycetes bacterium]|nr:hypothetical protein [Planctomycetota bacterium]
MQHGLDSNRKLRKALDDADWALDDGFVILEQGAKPNLLESLYGIVVGAIWGFGVFLYWRSSSRTVAAPPPPAPHPPSAPAPS